MNNKFRSAQEGAFLPSIASLQAFEQAADKGTFALAAKELGRTSSAVSHSIKEIEMRLGVQLFEKAGRNVRLTEAGLEFKNTVDQSLKVLRQGIQRIEHYRETNVVRISALPFFTSCVLLPNLENFERKYPKLQLQIETTSQYADVANNEADIAIRFGDSQSDRLSVEPLVRIYGRPVCSPAYIEKHGAIENIDQLTHHTLLNVNQRPDSWEAWFNSHGVELTHKERWLNFDSILGALDAAARGQGVALAMAPLIEDYPGYGTLLVPALPTDGGLPNVYNIVCLAGRKSEQKIRAAISWLTSSVARFESLPEQ